MQLWIQLFAVAAIVNFLVVRDMMTAAIAAGVTTVFAYFFMGIR